MIKATVIAAVGLAGGQTTGDAMSYQKGVNLALWEENLDKLQLSQSLDCMEAAGVD